jgi:hypothetical protein
VNGTETFSENGDSDGGGDGAAILIGWSGGPITTIQFELTSASDDTANDFAIGAVSLETAVPEPSTWAMMLLGFAGLGFRGLSGIAKDRCGARRLTLETAPECRATAKRGLLHDEEAGALEMLDEALGDDPVFGTAAG